MTESAPEQPTSTYSGDPQSSPKDEVRFLLGDTQPDEWLLTDTELEYLLKRFEGRNSITFVAAAACDAIMAKLAREIDINADGQSLAFSQLMDRYKALGEELRDQAAEEVSGASEFHWDAGNTSGYPPSFGLRMWDNPEAGLQDYGDIDDYRYRWPGGIEDQRIGGY